MQKYEVQPILNFTTNGEGNWRLAFRRVETRLMRASFGEKKGEAGELGIYSDLILCSVKD